MTLRERIMQRVRNESEAAGTYAGIIQVIALGDLEGVLAEELPAADAERERLAVWLDGVAKAYATTDADMPQPPPNVITYSDSVNAAKAARLLREPAGVNDLNDIRRAAMRADKTHGHRWVQEVGEREGVAWCDWCGVHRIEVPDWADNPACPASVAAAESAPREEEHHG